MLERFTEEARQALVMAQQSARALRCNSLDSGTLLLGLLTDDTDAAIRALAQQGIRFETVRQELRSFRGPAFPVEQSGTVPYTEESMALIDTAFRESKKLKHKGVLTTGHLVLAMVRTPGSLAAQMLLALGADLTMIELAVAAGHMPSLPDAEAVLPEEFGKLLSHQASLSWPKPRFFLASAIVSALWYLATLAIIVTGSFTTVGPELVFVLAVAGLLGLTVQHVIRVRAAAVPAPGGSSLVSSPPELIALVSRWGITDFAIWLRDDFRLDDHAVRLGAKARISVSREIFNRPAESGFVVAHELAHLLRNDSARAMISRWLQTSLVLAALVTFTPWIWMVTAASVVLYGVASNWAAELGSDRIAVTLHGYQQMVSFQERTHASNSLAYTHPPYAWRLWLARRATL